MLNPGGSGGRPPRCKPRLRGRGRKFWRYMTQRCGQSPTCYGRSPQRCGRSPQRCGRSPQRCGRSPQRCSRSQQRCGRSQQRCSQSQQRCGRSPQRCGRSPTEPPLDATLWPVSDRATSRLNRCSQSQQRCGRSPTEPQRCGRSPTEPPLDATLWPVSDRATSRLNRCSRSPSNLWLARATCCILLTDSLIHHPLPAPCYPLPAIPSPKQSHGASCKSCATPRYRSVVWILACPSES